LTTPADRAAADEDFVAAPCAVDVDLYLHPLLEDPPARSSADPSTWAQYVGLVARAQASCAGCPLLADCLYKAVVHTDVAGYVGCTTPLERRAIRRRLGIAVRSEDLDTYAGTRGTRQPVEHDDVLRMRAAHPDDSLESLAARLDCSLSTVKRHLRRARREASGGGDREPAEPEPPTMDEIFHAFESVVEKAR